MSEDWFGPFITDLLEWSEQVRLSAIVYFTHSAGVDAAIEALRRETRIEAGRHACSGHPRPHPRRRAPTCAPRSRPSDSCRLIENAASSWLTQDAVFLGLGRRRFVDRDGRACRADHRCCEPPAARRTRAETAPDGTLAERPVMARAGAREVPSPSGPGTPMASGHASSEPWRATARVAKSSIASAGRGPDHLRCGWPRRGHPGAGRRSSPRGAAGSARPSGSTPPRWTPAARR